MIHVILCNMFVVAYGGISLYITNLAKQLDLRDHDHARIHLAKLKVIYLDQSASSAERLAAADVVEVNPS